MPAIAPDPALTPLVVLAALLLVWPAVSLVVRAAAAVAGRRLPAGVSLRGLAMPLGLAAGAVASRVALSATARGADWFAPASFGLVALLIAGLAWAAVRAAGLVETGLLARYEHAGVDDRRARRIRTQTVLLRRILQAAIVTLAVAVVLLTLPAVRSLGAGLLASAGLVSVIAALAVQSTLTNVLAGVQLAFTDAVRVGDVVQMGEVFGTVEDVTLSNVVVKLWDGRRMIYPSSDFTTKAFENWTRVGSEVSGVVEMDVDWRVSMDALRARLKALVATTPLWDGREASMQVTDAIGGLVRIRAVVSARTSGDLWDLRCLVREDLVVFLRAEHPEAIPPRMVEAPAVQTPAPLTRAGEDTSLYTGSFTAVRRGQEFAGPGEEAFAQRQRAVDPAQDVEERT